MKAIIKELFIMALLLMVVVFMVGIVFYEYMPNNKTVPEPIAYRTDSSTTAILQEISSTTTDSGTNNTTTTAVDEPIISYSIGSEELSTAASKHSFTSGKTDPFAEYVEPVATTTDGNTTDSNTTTNTTGTNTTSSTSTSQGSTSSSNGGSKTNSDSNSTGTFFEKPNSK